MKFVQVIGLFVAAVSISTILKADTYKEWEGTWRPGSHSFINMHCKKSWYCDCGLMLKSAESKLERVPNEERTNGICATTGDAVDTCSECMAPRPLRLCVCRIRPAEKETTAPMSSERREQP
jgi:hypothetical protein